MWICRPDYFNHVVLKWLCFIYFFCPSVFKVMLDSILMAGRGKAWIQWVILARIVLALQIIRIHVLLPQKCAWLCTEPIYKCRSILTILAVIQGITVGYVWHLYRAITIVQLLQITLCIPERILESSPSCFLVLGNNLQWYVCRNSSFCMFLMCDSTSYYKVEGDGSVRLLIPAATR